MRWVAACASLDGIWDLREAGRKSQLKKAQFVFTSSNLQVEPRRAKKRATSIIHEECQWSDTQTGVARRFLRMSAQGPSHFQEVVVERPAARKEGPPGLGSPKRRLQEKSY